MVRGLATSTLFCLGLVATEWCLGDVKFTLGFDGPSDINGAPGTTGHADVFCTLAHQGDAPSAAGWSFGVEASNARIVAVDFDSSQAAALFQDGFEATNLAAGPGGAEGAICAVVLGFDGRSLPPNTVHSVARLGVEARIPAAGAESHAELRYSDRLSPPGGQSVAVIVSLASGASVIPEKSTLSMRVSSAPCNDPGPCVGCNCEVMRGILVEKGLRLALKARGTLYAGVDSYNGDGSEIRVLIDGVDYLQSSDEGRKFKLNRTGTSIKVTQGKKKLVINLRKRVFQVSFPDVLEDAINTADGLTVGLVLGPRLGVVTSPLTPSGKKLIVDRATGSFLPAPEVRPCGGN
jgi:hypothetical protein